MDTSTQLGVFYPDQQAANAANALVLRGGDPSVFLAQSHNREPRTRQARSHDPSGRACASGGFHQHNHQLNQTVNLQSADPALVHAATEAVHFAHGATLDAERARGEAQASAAQTAHAVAQTAHVTQAATDVVNATRLEADTRVTQAQSAAQQFAASAEAQVHADRQRANTAEQQAGLARQEQHSTAAQAASCVNLARARVDNVTAHAQQQVLAAQTAQAAQAAEAQAALSQLQSQGQHIFGLQAEINSLRAAAVAKTLAENEMHAHAFNREHSAESQNGTDQPPPTWTYKRPVAERASEMQIRRKSARSSSRVTFEASTKVANGKATSTEPRSSGRRPAAAGIDVPVYDISGSHKRSGSAKARATKPALSRPPSLVYTGTAPNSSGIASGPALARAPIEASRAHFCGKCGKPRWPAYNICCPHCGNKNAEVVINYLRGGYPPGAAHDPPLDREGRPLPEIPPIPEFPASMFDGISYASEHATAAGGAGPPDSGDEADEDEEEDEDEDEEEEE